jgi:hypothetical protein
METSRNAQWKWKAPPGSPAIILAAFAACLFSAHLSGAENKTSASSGEVPVQMVVTVEARHATEVPSLKSEDFLAYRGHERLRVTDVVPLQGEHAALELFLLIDDASSSSLGSQIGDLRKFVEAQPATTAIGIGYMRNGTFSVVQNFTGDHAGAAQTVRLPFSSGGVSPWLSLSDLIKRWPGNLSRRAVVLVSSGFDSLGGPGPTNPYLDTAIENAQRDGVVIYAIYTPGAGHTGHSFWRTNLAQSHLAQIAEETGGEAYMLGFGPPVSFEPYLSDVTERMTHQYRVTFLATPGAKGEFQNIGFSTEVPNAELVAAARVWVPAGRGGPSR